MKSSRHVGMLPFLALILIGLMSFAPGCSSDKKSGPKGGTGGTGGTEIPLIPCETSEECPSTDRCDLVAKVCVPKCTADNQCPRDTGTYCDLESGECVPGEPCEGDFTCGTDRKFKYCEDTGDCVCAPDKSIEEDPDRPGNGVCWRVAKSCEPCSESFECGNSAVFGNDKAECKVFPVGNKEVGVCLPNTRSGRCPPGMVQMDTDLHPELAGLCMPQGGDCGNMVVCTQDADCLNPATPVCDPMRQICIPGCTFDYADGTSVGCAPGRVCHATPAGTDPALLNDCVTAPSYGVGTCDVACTEDSHCAKFDPSFICVADVDDGPKRCRPQSKTNPGTAGCLDDRECGYGAQGDFLGYCDVNTNDCVYDSCRAGPDPRRGCGSSRLYEDCVATHKCEEGDEIGFGTCVEKNCIENGGADIGCLLGNFCAGEQYRDMLTGQLVEQVVESPEGTPIGECFPMDLPTWCEASCQSNADCVGKGPVTIPGSPGLCRDYGIGPTCVHGCEYNAQCPAGWSCSSQGLEVQCHGYQTCTTDAQCGAGNRCVDPFVRGDKAHFPDGLAPFKVCECSGTDSCNDGFSCGAGVATASLDVTSPAFEKVTARYCSNNTECGSGGSCEWWGTAGLDANANLVPVFTCAASTPTMVGGRPATCPEDKGSRQGRTAVDLYNCVISQICQPGYLPPAQEGEAPECGVALRDP